MGHAMKAVWYTQTGDARDVLVFGELPTPEPKAGEVRVKLHTSGVNPSDVKTRSARPLGDERIVPHSDGAGVIDAVGEGFPIPFETLCRLADEQEWSAADHHGSER